MMVLLDLYKGDGAAPHSKEVSFVKRCVTFAALISLLLVMPAATCAFVEERTGVKLTGIFAVKNDMRVDGLPEMYFGPGLQWEADTEDDCWAVTVHNETHIQPFVVLHGTTGQVLYWSYNDLQNHCTYVNMLPDEDDMSREAAAELGRSRCTEALRSMVCPVFEGSMELAFGTAGNWMPVGEEEAPMSVSRSKPVPRARGIVTCCLWRRRMGVSFGKNCTAGMQRGRSQNA